MMTRSIAFAALALSGALLVGCSEAAVPQAVPTQPLMMGNAGTAVTAPVTPAPEPEPTPVAPAAPTPLGPLTTQSGMIRIMAVGDSITSSTCWRADLWQQLTVSFPGRFDLVGTLTSDSGCTPAGYDQDNQGYGSSLVTEIAAGITTARTCQPTCPSLGDLQQAFTAKPSDVALMHFGTNDVWNSRPTEDIVSAYTAVVGALRAANPKVVILVAQIIPMNVTDVTCGGCTCAGCASNVSALNTRIVSWAAEHDSADSPIRVVDQFTGYDATLDNREGVHPNAQGSQKISDQWFVTLAPLF